MTSKNSNVQMKKNNWASVRDYCIIRLHRLSISRVDSSSAANLLHIYYWLSWIHLYMHPMICSIKNGSKKLENSSRSVDLVYNWELVGTRRQQNVKSIAWLLVLADRILFFPFLRVENYCDVGNHFLRRSWPRLYFYIIITRSHGFHCTWARDATEIGEHVY